MALPVLDRRAPSDWKHYERYPVAALAKPPTGVPVAIAVNWYESFDSPEKLSNRWWIGRGPLGAIRGGHCVAIPSSTSRDDRAWYRFYDQGTEGACVGFGSSRVMTHLNSKRYDARWLYHEAQKIDEWPGEDYEGTSLRAAMDVLRTAGHKLVRSGREYEPSAQEGISANRWARNVDETLATLNNAFYKKMGAVPILNSWGTAYPHKVWMPLETLERLIQEDGEVALISDR